MFVLPIDYVLFAWFVLALASTAYVAYDQFRNNPEPSVMKWGFVLVTLYMGPIGLLLYVLADKEPRPGTHEEFVRPLWKQGIGSTVHCVAGDATGIILAAVVTATIGLSMWQDLIIEYIAGFAFGLFIFQALFMRKMMGGTYLENLKHSFLPEFLSMNMMMAGMAPVMSLWMMGRDMRAMEPTEFLFWGVMSAGVIVGFAIAYPVNVWMVSKGLKHGLMTVRLGSEQRDTQSPKAHETPTAAHRPRVGDAFAVTSPQLVSMGMVTLIALAAGMGLPALKVNMSLGADDVGGAIMPPGMVMTNDTPAEAMREMAAIDPRDSDFEADLGMRGGQVLNPVAGGTVDEYKLTASVVGWRILDKQKMNAYAYNQQVPGPTLKLTQGRPVRIVVKNELPDPTTVHWHGLVVPNEMDGPAYITQPPIKPGDSFTYEFTPTSPGTYFYHSHNEADRQQALGLYGALIVRPRNESSEHDVEHDVVVQLQEWLEREGLTFPAMNMEGAMPNFFTINGKAYPDTEPIRMKVGELLKVRFIGSNTNFVHPMHIHGGPFEVVARDGETVKPSARFEADTINVAPGQRYDVIWRARRPGKWLLHCHIPHHTTNNNVEERGAGGLTTLIEVT